MVIGMKDLLFKEIYKKITIYTKDNFIRIWHLGQDSYLLKIKILDIRVNFYKDILMIKMESINVINIHIQVGLSMGGKMGMEF